MTDIPDRSHNVLLDALLMRGSLGLALWLVNIGFLGFVLAKRLARTAPARIALFALIAHTVSMQFSFVNATDAVFLMPLWAILLLSTLKWRPVRFSLAGASSKGILAILLLAVAYFGISRSYRLLRTDTLFQSSIGMFLQSDAPGLPLAHFDSALAASPQYGYLYRSMFIFFRDDVLKNPALVPVMKEYASRLDRITSGGFHAQLAHAEVALAEGDAVRASAFFSAAEKLAPNWPVLWMEQGEMLYSRSDYAGAAEKFEKLLALAPPYWQWGPELENRTTEEREKYRIFRISNQRFYEALEMLAGSYEHMGEEERAGELRKFL